jgi:hypothetical protein
VILVNLSGRGDKDVDTAAKWFGMIGEGESAEDADGTAIAEGRDPGLQRTPRHRAPRQGAPDGVSEPSPDTSFADPASQTEGIQL